MKRGDVYRVNLEPTTGRELQGNARPCVVFSIEAINVNRGTVLVVPLTSSPRPLPPIYVSAPSAGHPNATAICDQLRAIDKSRLLGKPMCALSAADLQSIEVAVRHILKL